MNAIEQLQRAVNTFARAAQFNPVVVDGQYREEVWKATQFVAKFIYVLRQEGRRVVEAEASDQFLLALGTSSWPYDVEDRASQITAIFERAAVQLGFVVPGGTGPSSGTIALWGVVIIGSLWALNRYVVKG